MSCPAPIELCSTRGSDVSLEITLTDESGAVNLTGRSVSAFDVSPALEGKVSASITNAASGIVTVTVEGTTPVAVGRYSFRVQITGTGDSIGLPPFFLKVV